MRWLCRVVCCLLCCLGGPAWLLAAGCSGGSSGGSIGNDAAADDKDAAADGETTALTCQDIRTRIFTSCDSEINKPCVDGIIAKATPVAQEAFRALAACTLPFCTSGAFYCTCEQRCFGDGHCMAETEACAAGGPDVVCDELCH